MGYGEKATHQTLTLTFVGSSPTSPAIELQHTTSV